MMFATSKHTIYTLAGFDQQVHESRAGNARMEAGMSKGSKTTPRGRDAASGQFTTVKEAKDHPRTHVVERVPKPGYGDTKK
jgi:hypothetical protein